VRARHFVLAAGGIENARLLLASRSVLPSGVGNGYGQVGRHFMEHPHARGGHIVANAAWPLLRAFALKHVVRGEKAGLVIAGSPAMQARRGILNSSLTIAARKPASGSESWSKRAYLH